MSGQVHRRCICTALYGFQNHVVFSELQRYGTGQFSLFLDSDTIVSVGSDLRQAFPLESVVW
jgi:hypothetical protein